ncbi:hypothetical protein R5R35_000495 [Gryllus longicercus]|uniref:Alpha-amylase n=1 Tax=Gryllus longicercus TaxID=2509291 RepID=A0AAN9V9K6_9ORTH
MACGLRALAVCVALAAATPTPTRAQKNPYALPGRSAVVHLFEWKFRDIARECEEFLAPMGYAAVQTSPIAEHLSQPKKGHPWWERYQPMSFRIVSRSGNESRFAEMVERCNYVGVRVYVDVVFNHMTGPLKPARSIAGTSADGINRNYPEVPFHSNHFNPKCDIHTYNDVNQVRNCLLSGLNDLNQTNTYVREKIIDFLNRLIDHGVAGFRVDAAKHMWPADLEYIYSQVKNLSARHGFAPGLRPFIYQEVIDLGGEGVKKTDYNAFARVTEFKYGAEIGNVFRGHNAMKWLKNFGSEWGLLPSGDALVFVDNHDNQRGHGAGGPTIITHKEPRLYKMAVAFMLSWPYGYPRVMSSYSFNNTDKGPPINKNSSIKNVTITSNGKCGNGWVCEHRWPAIVNMIEFRNKVDGTAVANWWDNGNYQIAYSRGDKGFIVFNEEMGADLKQILKTGLAEGSYCDVISGKKMRNKCTGRTVDVGKDGNAAITLLKEEEGVLAIHIGSKIHG